MKSQYSSYKVLLVLAALMLAALACLPGSGDPTPVAGDAVATSVAATLTAVSGDGPGTTVPPTTVPPTVTALPTTGTVSGNICYPSDHIPAMMAYFEEISTHALIPMPVALNQSNYTIDLPPGTYHAYIWNEEYNIGGSYSQAVPCGLHVGCTDHSLLPVNVVAGGAVAGIDLCDWYGNPGDVPVPPGMIVPTPVPPPGGVSLNCDDTFQRVWIDDTGATGKILYVDNWNGTDWINIWEFAGGDAMIRQIEDEAGYYNFGTCKKLIAIPLRYVGSGAILELSFYRWTGSGLSLVYSNDGVHGTWFKTGDVVTFEESIYLFGEPNCCPCNRQILEHTWNGSAFIQTGSGIVPTYTGDPPDHCIP